MEHFWNNFFSVFGFISGLVFTVIFFHAVGMAYKKIRRYLKSETPEDTQSNIQNFIDEWCRQDAQAEITAQNLYAAYEIWCAEKDEEPLTQSHFGRHMAAMEFKRVCRGPCSYVGFALNDLGQAKTQAAPGQ